MRRLHILLQCSNEKTDMNLQLQKKKLWGCRNLNAEYTVRSLQREAKRPKIHCGTFASAADTHFYAHGLKINSPRCQTYISCILG